MTISRQRITLLFNRKEADRNVSYGQMLNMCSTILVLLKTQKVHIRTA